MLYSNKKDSLTLSEAQAAFAWSRLYCGPN